MPLYFAFLALKAGYAQVSDVAFDGGSDKFAGDQELGSSDDTMLVMGLEDSPSEGRRDVQAWTASRGFTDEGGATGKRDTM